MTLLEIIRKAIDHFSGQKAVINAQKDELVTLRSENANHVTRVEDLQKKLADEDLDDAALQAAVDEAQSAKTAAEERAVALQAQLDELEAPAAELAAAINENPEVPEIDVVV